jgi:hypothetical protein
MVRVALANRLAHAMLLGTSGNETIYPTVALCESIGVNPETITRIEQTARQQTDDMKLVMLSQAAGTPWPQRAEQIRAQLQAPFRPVVASLEPALDAVRIFCETLAGPVGDEPATVVVVHAASADQAPALGAKLREMDPDGEARPLILLCPEAALTAQQLGMPGRAARQLPMPLPIARFLEAVNALCPAGAAPLRAAA